MANRAFGVQNFSMLNSIKKQLQIAEDCLKKNKIPSFIIDAEIILAHVLNKSKEFIYTYPEFALTKKQISEFQTLIDRRTKGEPVAYLTNHKEFYGLDLLVNKDTLIPRPETEILVDESIKLIHDSCSMIHDVVDIGTGAGGVAIAIATHTANVRAQNFVPQPFAMNTLATDISARALIVSKKNAKKHCVKIKFYHGNLYQPVLNKKIDLVVANLPYGWKEWKNNCSMDSKGLKFEPAIALFTKEKGLYLYRKLFEQIQKAKYLPKYILLEFDPRQTTDIKKLARRFFPNAKISIIKDLAGKNRVIKMQI